MSKKERIMKAAVELFAEKGFNGTAASEIAERAGVAQGTVFHHFKSKNNLLACICEDLVRENVEGMRAVACGPGSGYEVFERTLAFSLRFLRERTNQMSISFREAHLLQDLDPEYRERFINHMAGIVAIAEDLIRRGIEDGSIKQDVPALETAFLIHSLVKGIHHSRAYGTLEMPEVEGEVLNFCRRSLAAAPATTGIRDGGD